MWSGKFYHVCIFLRKWTIEVKVSVLLFSIEHLSKGIYLNKIKIRFNK